MLMGKNAQRKQTKKKKQYEGERRAVKGMKCYQNG